VATISYIASGGAGCGISKTITVNMLPSAISGSLVVCQGSTTALSSTPGGGSWSSSSSGIAAVSSSGVVSGTVTGSLLTAVATITYTLPVTGCLTTAPVTVTPLPTAITGPTRVCQGATVTLSCSPAGGTWSSANTSIATISSTGVVTGASTAGVTTITYSLSSGCIKTTNITVNVSPSPIIGPGGVCVGQTAVFSDPTPSGTWSSSTPAVGSISSSGIAAGLTAGITNIVYTLPGTGCNAVAPFTVIALPAPIGGSTNVCIGGTTTLTDATVGGIWSSSLPGVATVSSSGVVTGISSGTTIISYGVGSGCMSIVPVIVNPLPPINGNFVICVGQSTHLSDTALGGTWSTTSTAASVDAAGTVTGIGSGGLATIIYSRLGCSVSQVVTVNPVPGGITGLLSACVGQTSPLAALPAGGIWASSSPGVASITASGTVTAIYPDTTTITYTLSATGCFNAAIFTVNPLPAAIGGPNVVCIGNNITLLDPTPGGTWSTTAPATVATVASTTGVVTGVGAGAATVVYSIAGGVGCTSSTTVNVSPVPGPNTGPDSVCSGSTVALTPTVPGGTWSASPSSIASVDALGNVSGLSPGVANIVYSIGAGCDAPVFTMSVNVLPFPISPSSGNICSGDTLRLTEALSPGSWSTATPSVASVDATGLVTGLAPGSSVIGYTLTRGGCATSINVNVNPGPTPIIGTPIVCVGATTNLSNATTGGSWSSSNAAVATVDPFGAVMGMTPGTTLITYAVPGFTCPAVQMITVNAAPAAIVGSPDICQGATATLTDAVGGGAWSSSVPGAVAIGASTGVATAAISGATSPVPVVITYSTGPVGTGCDATFNLNANPLPAPISGPDSVCSGQTITLFDATTGGTWNSGTVAIATVSSTGTVTGVTGGVVDISYSNTYACPATYSVTVNTSPTPIAGSSNVCLGGTSTLSSTPLGGRWRSFNTAIASVGASSGVVTGNALGSTIIEYQVTGACRANFTVYVQPLPVVYSVTGGGNHCSGDAGVHIGLNNSAVGVNYMLYNGTSAVGAFAGTGSLLDFGLHAAAGTYTVIGTTTATGCSRNMSGSAVVGITPSVTPSVTLSVSPNDTVCSGATTVYTPIPANGGLTPSYRWIINGTPVAIAGSYSYIPANRDTVVVEMTSTATCPSPATVRGSMVMTVLPFGTPHINIAALPNDTLCKGDVATMTASVDFAGTNPVFTWVKNTYVIAGVTTPTYAFVPNNGDFVWAKLSSDYPCRLVNYDTSNTITLTVDNPVTPVVTITGNYIVGKGQYDTLTASVAGAVYPTYQWYINGLPIAAATNATFIHKDYSYPQVDSVSCVVTNHGVCTVTGHQWMFIQSTTVGVQNVTAEGNISVVPNPNKGEFMIKGNLGSVNDEAVTIEITDMIGQAVYNNKVTARGGTLNEHIVLSRKLANGMYMLTVRSESESKVFHIVVEQ